MDLHKIAKDLRSGNLIKIGNTLLTKEQHSLYQEAIQLSEYNDMLQGVRKVLL